MLTLVLADGEVLLVTSTSTNPAQYGLARTLKLACWPEVGLGRVVV